ncbi:MAG: glycosyltransferase, partial [Methylacidiphilales bacterium]|nr:glycosyltransferase [Candidatus Methylacidiphilales bacterium]
CKALAAAAVAALVATESATAAAHVLLSLVFLGWVALRGLALMHRDDASQHCAAGADRDLPRYTIVVPLYREAQMVAPLLDALGALDYPREKLEILLVVEDDDAETRRAITAVGVPPHVKVVVAPAIGPRTKPKALNVALPFALGDYLVVYDAEDQPEPGQLRQAVAAFRTGSRALACVQARLAIENAKDGWLTQLFAGEYAGQFDVLLPMVTAHHLPLPLGGTSNHFRLDVLRRVGGWDAFNVTEDADLGIRLARFGWQTGLIASTTWEEAPRHLPAWLKQRTRWFKGWMQTWLVHMRQPRRLQGDLGFAGFLAFQLMIGGSVLSALVHPVFVLALALQAATGLVAAGDGLGAVLTGLTIATLVFGYAVSAALVLAGLARRRLLSIGWVVATLPVYWLLLSAAAWRAAWQLAVDPFHWEKTEHGFARTSVRPKPAPKESRNRQGPRGAAARWRAQPAGKSARKAG